MIAWFTPQALVLGLSGVFLTIMVEWDGRASYLFPSNDDDDDLLYAYASLS